jgi:hypothetical protein
LDLRACVGRGGGGIETNGCQLEAALVVENARVEPRIETSKAKVTRGETWKANARDGGGLGFDTVDKWSKVEARVRPRVEVGEVREVSRRRLAIEVRKVREDSRLRSQRQLDVCTRRGSREKGLQLARALEANAAVIVAVIAEHVSCDQGRHHEVDHDDLDESERVAHLRML